MAKRIQAYFQNESEAMHVKVQLMEYDISNVEIGETGGDIRDGVPLLLPLSATGVSDTIGMNAAGTGGVAVGNAAVAGGGIPAVLDNDKDYPVIASHLDGLRTTLTAEISEAHYAEAVLLIRHNKGHVATAE